MMTLFLIGLTIGVYLLSLTLSRWSPSILTMPIFFSTTLIILFLKFTDISYDTYGGAKDIITTLLGPATVALAVPLYQERETMKRYVVPVVTGVLAGSVATIVSVVAFGKWLGLSEITIRSLTVKSVTTPIATEVAELVQGEPALAVVFVVITGMAGAMFGPAVLDATKITDPLARGLSYGTISHGIGTSQAMQENMMAGAASGIAMGLAGLLTSLILPFTLSLFM